MSKSVNHVRKSIIVSSLTIDVKIHDSCWNVGKSIMMVIQKSIDYVGKPFNGITVSKFSVPYTLFIKEHQPLMKNTFSTMIKPLNSSKTSCKYLLIFQKFKYKHYLE